MFCTKCWKKFGFNRSNGLAFLPGLVTLCNLFCLLFVMKVGMVGLEKGIQEFAAGSHEKLKKTIAREIFSGHEPS